MQLSQKWPKVHRCWCQSLLGECPFPLLIAAIHQGHPASLASYCLSYQLQLWSSKWLDVPLHSLSTSGKNFIGGKNTFLIPLYFQHTGLGPSFPEANLLKLEQPLCWPLDRKWPPSDHCPLVALSKVSSSVKSSVFFLSHCMMGSTTARMQKV